MIIKLTEFSLPVRTQSIDYSGITRQKYTASESSGDPTRFDALSIASLQQYVSWMAAHSSRYRAAFTQVANRIAVLTGLGSGRSDDDLTRILDLYEPLYPFPRKKKGTENGKTFIIPSSLSLSRIALPLEEM